MKDYTVLVILLMLWCIVHSALISNGAINFFKKFLRRNFRFFRIAYNFFAMISLIPILIYSRSIGSEVIWKWEGNFITIQVTLIIGVAALFYFGSRSYDLKQFLGLTISDNFYLNSSHKKQDFESGGINKWIRHPWYSAALVLIWCRTIDTAVLCQNAVFTLYIFVGTYLEEKKLIREFGNAYREYQRKVPAFFPRLSGKMEMEKL